MNALLRLTFPTVTVGVCLLASLLIPAFADRPALFIFVAAVTASFWFGGLTSGLLAVLLSVIATAMVLHPSLQFAGGLPTDALLRWGLFVVVLVLIGALCARHDHEERSFRSEEEHIGVALEGARAGIWDYNPIKREFWWSKSLEQICGRTDGSFPRTYAQFFNFIHFDDQPAFNRALTRAIDEGIEFNVEHRIIMPDGSIRRVCTRGRLFYDSHSRTQRIAALVTEVTTNHSAVQNSVRHKPTPLASTAVA